MNSASIEKLRCPACRQCLTTHVFVEEKFEADHRGVPGADASSHVRLIRDGVLVCDACSVGYPVASYVPIMLVFPIPFHDYFWRKYEQEFSNLGKIGRPQGVPEPGEESIQQTFTEQWDIVSDSELTFSYTIEDLRDLHRRVWLKWQDSPPDDVRRILNVGCGGQGAEAEALYDISHAEVFGIDLTPALLHAGPRLRNKPSLNLVVASVFHCPFETRSFDLVYSQGVLHHTYSTYEAFKWCTEYVTKGGQVCIWVYGLEDHLARKGFVGLVQRLKYYGEEYLYFRFIISRLPGFLRSFCVTLLAVFAHPWFKIVKRHGGRWKFSNTQHSIRDRLTHRYAHKHSFNEVIEWYENLGFTAEVHSPAAYRALFNRPLWGIGLRGTRLRD